MLTITTTQLPDWDAGVAYNQTIATSGGTPPVTFSVTGGALPTGLQLIGSSIAGVPTANGNYTFQVTATDSLGATASQVYVITIAVAPTINAIPLPGAVGRAYSCIFTMVGGTGAATFLLLSGTLPPGLSLSASGLLTGTPSTVGTYSFVVQVTDAVDGTNTSMFTVAVGPSVPMRTNVTAVQKALGDAPSVNRNTSWDGVTDVSQYIELAYNKVSELIQVAQSIGRAISSVAAENVERLLAAHYYCMMDPTYTSRSTAGGSGSFNWNTDMYLEGSRFGQMALSQDPTGVLRLIANKQRIVAHGYSLQD